jgi:hypothetical protein
MYAVRTNDHDASFSPPSLISILILDLSSTLCLTQRNAPRVCATFRRDDNEERAITTTDAGTGELLEQVASDEIVFLIFSLSFSFFLSDE